MRLCTRKDFEKLNSEQIYDDNFKADGQGNALVCADNENEYFVGLDDDVKNSLQSFTLTAKYSDEETKKKIEAFLTESIFEMNVLHEQLDFSKYHQKPVK